MAVNSRFETEFALQIFAPILWLGEMGKGK